ncbi:hypothetical protein CBS101457_002898 [Exobasidium rhododendri]|nr:hypothetical protein CBS101457_002898 [Exobasidium rhododendri]
MLANKFLSSVAQVLVLAAVTLAAVVPTKTDNDLAARNLLSALSPPLGYNFAWFALGARLTMLPGGPSQYTYMTRLTLDKTARIATPAHITACAASCNALLNCAMANVVQFTPGTNTEGNIICSLYNAPANVKYAYGRNDGDNSMGSVQVSYEIDKVFDSWVWQSTPGTMCSEGTQTGYSLNAHQGSTDVVINFEDGGVCYDYASCYQNNRAFNMGTPFTAATFASQNIVSKLSNYFITTRTNSANPFAAASYAWLPYCTGDLHSGNASVIYSPNTVPTHHHGYLNSQAVMLAVKAALPNTKRVWITGSSAGGFGAILQYQQAVAIFGPNVRVDMIVDSAEAYGNNIFYPSLNMILPSTVSCPTCNLSNFDSILPGYAAATPTSRFAAFSFQSDSTLPGYEGVTQDAMDAEVASTFTTLNTYSNAKTFIQPGSGHIVISTPGTANNGVTAASFLQLMKNDSAAWAAGI